MIERHLFTTDEEECEDTKNGHVSAVKIELELSGSDRNAWFDFLIKKERSLILELDSDKILRLKNAKDANPIETVEKLLFERYQKSYLEKMDANMKSNLKLVLGMINDAASRGLTGCGFDEETTDELAHIMKICYDLQFRERKYRQSIETEKEVIQ